MSDSVFAASVIVHGSQSIEMAVERESQLVPTNQQLETLVWTNLEMIDGLSRADVERVLVGDVLGRTAHSSRIGGEVRICLREGDANVSVWGKRVENPELAFNRMQAAYERAARSGLAKPIPKPYFRDQQSGFVFMQTARGALLREAVFRHAISFTSTQGTRLASAMYQIGRWLRRYQDAIKLDGCFAMSPLVAEILARLERDESLPSTDKNRVATHLDRIERYFQQAPVTLGRVWPHNDFTLRNILILDSGDFFALDWDAMVHPKFSPATHGVWDVTLFLLNLYSLKRFRPFARGTRLDSLGENFVSGYLSSATANGGNLTKEMLHDLLYVFVLRYWYGIAVAKPLREVYRQNLGWRFCRSLRRRFASGPSALWT